MAYRGIKISPSVICLDWLNLSQELAFLQEIEADFLHLDICDSYFVPEFGLPFYIIKKLHEVCPIRSEYHLMVEEPKRIFEFIPPEKGAFVSVHYEACRNLHRELVTLRQMGFRPGVVINPATTLEHIEYVIEEVDLVVVMTVNPGFPSQKMVPQTLTKIERLRDWRERAGFEVQIMVDGNVSFENIPKMVGAGADILVLGTSGLFVNNISREDSVGRLKTVIDEGLRLRGE
jgi:ribulose-phosphate 3-epimerase